MLAPDALPLAVGTGDALVHDGGAPHPGVAVGVRVVVGGAGVFVAPGVWVTVGEPHGGAVKCSTRLLATLVLHSNWVMRVAPSCTPIVADAPPWSTVPITTSKLLEPSYRRISKLV